MKILLVTGSSGLIGSEVVGHFSKAGWTVHGVDNNMRADFFGPGGDTRWNTRRLKEQFPDFHHHELDIRDRAGVPACWRCSRKCGPMRWSTPPRSRATTLLRSRPFDDFDVNAVGAELPRSHAAGVLRLAVCPHEYEQGLW